MFGSSNNCLALLHEINFLIHSLGLFWSLILVEQGFHEESKRMSHGIGIVGRASSAPPGVRMGTPSGTSSSTYRQRCCDTRPAGTGFDVTSRGMRGSSAEGTGSLAPLVQHCLHYLNTGGTCRCSRPGGWLLAFLLGRRM